MLKDSVRTISYKKAIVNNPHLFKGKTVLDVGCGTGILSMFACQAGAAQVFAVDASDILDTARQVIADNGFSDRITCIKGKIEEIELPVTSVDIIVSEWMGYFLFYESMLNSVIFARDKWLAPGGIILPDKASVYICGIEDGDYKDEKINYWDNVYGFDMSCIKKQAILEPLVDTVNAQAVATRAAKIMTVDIHTVKVEDLTWMSPFKITATRNEYIHAFVAYFDIEFSKCHKNVVFATGPDSTYTHWKQTVFYLKDSITINEGESISGVISVAPNAGNHRDLDITLQYDFDGTVHSLHDTQEFRLR